MALIDFEAVSFGYGTVPVVQELRLAIEAGGIVSLMGPSGCGKSTVLRLIAGLEQPWSGSYRFMGSPIERPSGALRYAFQDYDAFQWRTVRENLLLAGASKDSHGPGFPLDDLMEKIGLTGNGHKYPAELSGGMRKRLGLGRCLAGKPKVVLLDEPFSSLDIDAKREMYALVQTLWSEWRCLFVIVTHELHEAILLSQQIVVSTPAPFRVKGTVQVPFEYPRDESISTSEKYLALAHRLRELLSLHEEQQ